MDSKTNSLKLEDIDYIVFTINLLLNLIDLLKYIDQAPFGFKSFKLAMPIWLKEKLFLKRHLIKIFKDNFQIFDENKLKFCEHHLSHAASAYYPSLLMNLLY